MPLPDHVLTTSQRSAGMNGRPWLRFQRRRFCGDGRWHIFTDGSSKGAYAAVVVGPAGDVQLELSEWRQPTKTRNIGGEWNGLLLGLRAAPEHGRVTIVCDLLWVHAQLIGVRKTVEPETQTQLAVAHRLIADKHLDVVLIHHDGHQKDDSDFTRWNVLADTLCAKKNKEIEAAAPAVDDVVEVGLAGSRHRAKVRVLIDGGFQATVLEDGVFGTFRLEDHGLTWVMPSDGRVVKRSNSKKAVKKRTAKA